MFLTGQQTSFLSQLIAFLAMAGDESALRTRTGDLLLRLLKADYYASYFWENGQEAFTNRVALNMSDANLANYEAYYQFHDPITHHLRRLREPTRITQILTQRKLVKTEFFNDFLWRDGLYWGVNLYVSIDDQSTADIRLWRGKQGENFTDEELAILKMIAPAYGAALNRCLHINKPYTPARSICTNLVYSLLTHREYEVARLTAKGLSDKEISKTLNISFPTVRTHIKNSFRKLDVSNRVQLACIFSQSPDGQAN